jgi:hypothetical protein
MDMKKRNLHGRGKGKIIGQYFAALTNMCSVGVMGMKEPMTMRLFCAQLIRLSLNRRLKRWKPVFMLVLRRFLFLLTNNKITHLYKCDYKMKRGGLWQGKL